MQWCAKLISIFIIARTTWLAFEASATYTCPVPILSHRRDPWASNKFAWRSATSDFEVGCSLAAQTSPSLRTNNYALIHLGIARIYVDVLHTEKRNQQQQRATPNASARSPNKSTPCFNITTVDLMVRYSLLPSFAPCRACLHEVLGRKRNICFWKRFSNIESSAYFRVNKQTLMKAVRLKALLKASGNWKRSAETPAGESLEANNKSYERWFWKWLLLFTPPTRPIAAFNKRNLALYTYNL